VLAPALHDAIAKAEIRLNKAVRHLEEHRRSHAESPIKGV
jgi:hypothetical protein